MEPTSTRTETRQEGKARRAARRRQIERDLKALIRGWHSADNTCCGQPMETGYDAMTVHHMDTEDTFENAHYAQCNGCGNIEVRTTEQLRQGVIQEIDRW